MAHNPERLSRLRAVMSEQGIDVLYIRGLSNVSWTTGFERVFDDEPAHALVVSDCNCVLHTDSRYFDAMESAAADTDIEVDNSRMAHSAVLAKVADGVDRDSVRIGIEDSMPLAEYRALQRTFEGRAVDLVELSGFVEELRQVKDESEIMAMRKAQSITDAAFAKIIAFMKPGMTEREVQLQLDRYMYEGGAEGLAFGTIVATGAHAASPHAIPGETKLAFGDAVVMDFGARYAGYCSDMTRTVFVGEPSDEVRRAYRAIRRANEECEAMLRAELSGAEVHQHAEAILEEEGFGGAMGHSLGHSVGIDIHEAPNLSPRNPKALCAGNIVTVEPGVYLTGKFGMRLEDYGVVRDTSYEVFTQSTHEMIIIS